MMNPLPLNKAFDLYKLLKGCIPDSGDSIITIAHEIIDKSDDMSYIESVSLMSNIPVKILVRRESNEILDLFLEGISVNEILELKSFCESIGM